MGFKFLGKGLRVPKGWEPLDFNMSTPIGEHIKYFMYKYNIAMSDWYNSFSDIYKKIYAYVNRKVDMNVKYTANAIQDVCEMRDLHNFELFENTLLLPLLIVRLITRISQPVE